MTEKHGHKHHGKSSREILNAMEVLEAITPEIGDKFLDAGCGDGYISIEASNIVGDQGKVYALDVYPESIETVKKEIKDRKLENVDAILADITNTIPLDSSSIDIVLMANVLHGFVAGGEVGDVMSNIVRLLKPDGIFAVVEFRKIENPVKDLLLMLEYHQKMFLIYSKIMGLMLLDSHEIGEYHYIVKGVKK